MFKNEVLIEKQDKEILQSSIETINEILDKYAYSKDYSLNTVTSMSKAKTLSKDLKEWIELLYTK